MKVKIWIVIKKINIYVFLSTFARSLIEVFIPIIFYKYGYKLKDVVFYYLLINIFSLIFAYPFLKIAQKYGYKILAIIGIISFICLQVLINNMFNNILYIVLLALFHALYRRGDWISRRYYTLNVMPKKIYQLHTQLYVL